MRGRKVDKERNVGKLVVFASHAILPRAQKEAVRLDISMDDMGFVVQPRECGDKLLRKAIPLSLAHDRIKHRTRKQLFAGRVRFFFNVCGQCQRHSGQEHGVGAGDVPMEGYDVMFMVRRQTEPGQDQGFLAQYRVRISPRRCLDGEKPGLRARRTWRRQWGRRGSRRQARRRHVDDAPRATSILDRLSRNILGDLDVVGKFTRGFVQVVLGGVNGYRFTCCPGQ